MPVIPRSTGAPMMRKNQNARLMTTIDTSNPIMGLLSDRKPTGLFSQEQRTNQTIRGTESRAIMHPAGLACHDWARQPRVNQANEVVIPQVGQRCPVSTANAHGPRPSCVWVPKPRGSGSNHRATTKSPPSPAAMSSKSNRTGRSRGCTSAGCGRIEGRASQVRCQRSEDPNGKARKWTGKLYEKRIPGKAKGGILRGNRSFQPRSVG
jgi:hypothetical protein